MAEKNENTWIQDAITSAKSELAATEKVLDEMAEKRASIEAKIEAVKRTQLGVLQEEWKNINASMAEQVEKTSELERVVRTLETVEVNLKDLGKLVKEREPRQWD